MKPIIEIWDFDTAPKELQDLSMCGGDEDYIVIVRGEVYNAVTFLLEGGGFLGLSHWDMYEYNGEQVWIGAHA